LFIPARSTRRYSLTLKGKQEQARKSPVQVKRKEKKKSKTSVLMQCLDALNKHSLFYVSSRGKALDPNRASFWFRFRRCCSCGPPIASAISQHQTHLCVTGETTLVEKCSFQRLPGLPAFLAQFMLGAQSVPKTSRPWIPPAA
jgi:hypothetical protein